MKRSTQATMSMFLKPTKHGKPCVTISCSDLSSDSSQPIAVDTNVPDNLRWSTASATQPHIEAHSDSGELTGTQSLEDSAHDAGQKTSATNPVWCICAQPENDKIIKCDNIDCEINYPAPYSAGYRTATGPARVVRSRTTSNRLYSDS